MINYQDYPKVMNHPGHQPATFKRESAEGLAKGLEPGTYDAKPALLAPITVHNPEQEEQAAARGYVPAGVSDAQAYRRATLKSNEGVPGVFLEFPKWKYHAIEEPVIVKNADEEEALGAGWADNPAGPFEEMGAAQDQGTTLEQKAPATRRRGHKSTSSRARA